MERSKLSKIIDITSLSILIFIVSFWVLNKFHIDNIYIITISCFISAVLTCSTIKLISVKHQIKLSRTTKKKKIESINFALKFGDNQKIKKFWIKLFSKNYIVTDNKSHLVLNNNKTILFYYNFIKSEISLEDLIQTISDTKYNTIFFCASSFSQDAITFANYKKNLKLLDLSATFMIFEKYNLYPTIKVYPKTKISILQKFRSAINKFSALKYFKYSAILLLLGIIFRKNLIYISFSIFLFLIAIISSAKKSTIKNCNIDI